MVLLMLLSITSSAGAQKPRRPGVAMENAGTVLTIMGGAMTVAGALLALFPRWLYPGILTCAPDEPCYMDVTAASVAGAGAALATVGIPLWVVGAKKHARVSITGTQLSVRF